MPELAEDYQLRTYSRADTLTIPNHTDLRAVCPTGRKLTSDLILVRCESYSRTPSQHRFFSSSALSSRNSDTAISSAALFHIHRGTLRRRSFRRQTGRRSIGPSALECSSLAYCSSWCLPMRSFASSEHIARERHKYSAGLTAWASS